MKTIKEKYQGLSPAGKRDGAAALSIGTLDTANRIEFFYHFSGLRNRDLPLILPFSDPEIVELSTIEQQLTGNLNTPACCIN